MVACTAFPPSRSGGEHEIDDCARLKNGVHPGGRRAIRRSYLEPRAQQVHAVTAISRYVDEAFPGPAPGGVRARMNEPTALLDACAYRPMVWGVFVERVLAPHEGRAANETLISAALDLADRTLNEIDRLHDGSPFLAGDEVTPADQHAFAMHRCGGPVAARLPLARLCAELLFQQPEYRVRTRGVEAPSGRGSCRGRASRESSAVVAG